MEVVPNVQMWSRFPRRSSVQRMWSTMEAPLAEMHVGSVLLRRVRFRAIVAFRRITPFLLVLMSPKSVCLLSELKSPKTTDLRERCVLGIRWVVLLDGL